MREMFKTGLRRPGPNGKREYWAAKLDGYNRQNFSEQEGKSCEASRCDQSSGKLGEPLGEKQLKLYLALLDAKGDPVSYEELKNKVYLPSEDVSIDCVFDLVFQIRCKLGHEEIVNVEKSDDFEGGYYSRRAKIRVENFSEYCWDLLFQSDGVEV